MPRAPPVMIATLPASSFAMYFHLLIASIGYGVEKMKPVNCENAVSRGTLLDGRCGDASDRAMHRVPKSAFNPIPAVRLAAILYQKRSVIRV